MRTSATAQEGPQRFQSLQWSTQLCGLCKQAELPCGSERRVILQCQAYRRDRGTRTSHVWHANGAEDSFHCPLSCPREQLCFLTGFSAVSLKSKTDFCCFHSVLRMDMWFIWDHLRLNLHWLYQNQMQARPYVGAWPQSNEKKIHPPATSHWLAKIKPVSREVFSWGMITECASISCCFVLNLLQKTQSVVTT